MPAVSSANFIASQSHFSATLDFGFPKRFFRDLCPSRPRLSFTPRTNALTMIKTNKFTWAALSAALLAAGTAMPMAHAQSADALLDKLVEKGVLTAKEASDLRKQS